uniref:unspecific monooxygenase n=1 Tax=Plutella xylostella TaxID=51655 RepID=Q52S21_PLUXY|nr:cytochrome P450 [Plutella xylostella]
MPYLDVAVALLAAFIAFTLWTNRRWNYWKKQNVKYLTPIPFLGNVADVIFQRDTFGAVTQRICQQFPDEAVVGMFYCSNPAALVQCPDMLKTVMVKDYAYCSSKEVSVHSHKEPMTKNMFFTFGDKWKLIRQNLTPVYTSAKMKNMFPLVQDCCRIFQKVLDDEIGKGRVVEVKSLIARYTMDCITSCAFGVDSGTMSKGEEGNPFTETGHLLFDERPIAGVKNVLRYGYPSFFYSVGLELYSSKIYRFFRSVILDVINSRNGAKSSRNDMVDLISDWKKNKYITGDSIDNGIDGGNKKVRIEVDDELLVSQCVLFFQAGFQPSALTSAYLLYELAKNQDIQERVLAEVDEYWSTRDEVQTDCVTALPFLAQCMEESLRMYPPVSVLMREIYKDYTLPNGVHLKKGMMIHIPVYHLHHNPKYFPEPEVFRPERFSEEGRKSIVPYTYLPFGDGPRMCIGYRFARLEIFSSLAVLLKKYRVELAPHMPRKLQFLTTSRVLTSIHGIHLRLVDRVN